MRWRVQVPATSANLGPGFDALGLALELYNEVEMEILGGAGEPMISINGEGASELPADRSHLIYQVMEQSCAERKVAVPRLRLNFLNRLPLARGLGSSAAARVLGVALAQLLCGGELHPRLLIEEASRLEGHPDNVAPCVLGGFVASLQSEGKILARSRPLHRDWRLLVTIPEFPLETSLSRQALPRTVLLSDAVFNVVRLPLLLAALEDGDSELLREASRDVLHQPYRVELVPGLREVFAAVISAGAAAVYLSGAGPTVASWVGPDGEQAARVAAAAESAFGAVGVRSRSLHLAVSARGAQAFQLA